MRKRTHWEKARLGAPGLAGEKSDFFSILLGCCCARQSRYILSMRHIWILVGLLRASASSGPVPPNSYRRNEADGSDGCSI